MASAIPTRRRWSAPVSAMRARAASRPAGAWGSILSRSWWSRWTVSIDAPDWRSASVPWTPSRRAFQRFSAMRQVMWAGSDLPSSCWQQASRRGCAPSQPLPRSPRWSPARQVPGLEGSVQDVRAQLPPSLARLGHRTARHAPPQLSGVARPALDRGWDPLAGELAGDDRPDGREPGVATLVERCRSGECGDLGEVPAECVVDPQRPVGGAEAT